MKVVITGTPGTGKTTVMDSLNSDFRKINLTNFIKENEVGEDVDEVTEVNTAVLRDKLHEELPEDKSTIIEGHLAHHFPADLCIVLRCNPEVLESRLSDRDYSDEKIKENVEAEALDIVLAESVEIQDNVLEIDTTEKSVEDVARRIEKGIENMETGYGDVDWSDSFQALF